MSSSPTTTERPAAQVASTQQEVQDCLACRIVGTAALGGVGVYALQMSRPHAPGSVVGKRIMAGVGVGFLIASAFRWTK